MMITNMLFCKNIKEVISLKNRIIFLTVLFLMLLALTPVLAKDQVRPSALDDKGPLTKITFIHYKKAFAKPPWAGGGSGSTNKCYSFLASGAKWKTVEDFVINPANSDGLTPSFIENAVLNGTSQWDFESLHDIFGNASVDSSVVYNDSSSDGVNTLSFGTYPDNNVIAVTNVWGYFYGSPKTRELVEWDMLLNTGSSWNWGDGAANPNLMDVANITAHELGHSAGMGHPDSSCTLETMYAYSSEGETLKRDLNTEDITGIKELYK